MAYMLIYQILLLVCLVAATAYSFQSAFDNYVYKGAKIGVILWNKE